MEKGMEAQSSSLEVLGEKGREKALRFLGSCARCVKNEALVASRDGFGGVIRHVIR